MPSTLQLPCGSTIILSTTSPDKRREYENIFKRFDVNFIFLDDLGLSPQKTDEMTNSYDGNLIQKACEVSLALFYNRRAIEDRLKSRGYDVGLPIVGMVEDSGIAIYPKDRGKSKTFKKAFKGLISYKFHDEFTKNEELRARCFPEMNEEAIECYLYNVVQNNDWMLDIGEDNYLPGPNFKPIYEALKGGTREIFDVMYDALEAVSKSSVERNLVWERRQLRFRNHCAMMLVEPHPEPLKYITALDIVTGENKGWLRSRHEMESFIGSRMNPREPLFKAGDFFTGDMLIPDGQRDTSNLSQQELIREGMLWTKNNKRAHYYRLQAAGKLKDKYNIPIARRYKYKGRVENTRPVRIMFLAADDLLPNQIAAMQHKLKDQGYKVINPPTEEQILQDPRCFIMADADVVFMVPDAQGGYLTTAQKLLAATVDKQVMPSSKEKMIVVLNPVSSANEGAAEPYLEMLRHVKFSGLKNGVAEVDAVIEYPQNVTEEALYSVLLEWSEKEANRKKHRLTDIRPIQAKKNVAPQHIQSIPKNKFTVFVAGGAANDYPEFKAAANQLGRFIYQKDWVLVTGAGQKDGPMGAVHSGFAEAYLEHIMRSKRGSKKSALRPKVKKQITALIDHHITDLLMRRHITGNIATKLHAEFMHAIFTNPDVEFLTHEAPEILLSLLQPKRGTELYDLIGSLKEERRMIGYSMPPLLISEGSGKWPMGMQGYNAGNMQRRMKEMLKSNAHVFLTGGQGTYQEVIESVILAIQKIGTDESPHAIYLLDQLAYKNGIYTEEGTVFRPTLKLIDQALSQRKLSREDIHLHCFDNMRELETELQIFASDHK